MNSDNYKNSPSRTLEMLGITSYSSEAFKCALESVGYTVEQQNRLCEDGRYYLINDGEEKYAFVSGETEEARCFYYSILLSLMQLPDSRDADEAQMVNAYMFASEIKKLLQTKEARDSSFIRLRNVYMSIFTMVVTLSTVGLLFLWKTVNKDNVNPLDTLPTVTASDFADFSLVSEPPESSSLTANILIEPSEQQAEYESVSNVSAVSNERENVAKQSSPAQQTFENEASGDENTKAYYATSSGKKYHISSCQYIKDISKCIELSDSDLFSGKYEPCKKCIK